jgi:parallel beta-helix repeat protein
MRATTTASTLSATSHRLPEAPVRSLRGFILALPVLTACSDGGTTSPPPTARTDGPSQSVAVTSAACGDVIVSDLRLENDLVCAGDALTVSATGVRINLHGHTISGNGTGVGIRVNASQDVSIQGGTIQGFLQGLFVASSTGIVIKDNELTQNATAVLLQASSGNTIKANIARRNSVRAFMFRPNLTGVVSTDNDVVDNEIIDNPTGILLISQPGNTFKGNTISGSTVAAIDMTSPPGASGNVIKGNLLTTSAVGIRLAGGWTGNTILGNTLQANSCALQGPTAGNTLQGNAFAGNSTDLCP